MLSVNDLIIVLMLPYYKADRKSWEEVWKEAYYLKGLGYKPAEHILNYIDRQQGTEINHKDIDMGLVQWGLYKMIEAKIGQSSDFHEYYKKHKTHLKKAGLVDCEDYINALIADAVLRKEMESKDRAGDTTTEGNSEPSNSSRKFTKTGDRKPRKDKGKKRGKYRPRCDKGQKRLIYAGKPTTTSLQR